MRLKTVTAALLSVCAFARAEAQPPSWITRTLPEVRVNDTAELPVDALSTALGHDGSMVGVWVANSFEVWSRPFDQAGHPAGPGRRIDSHTLGLFRVDSTVAAVGDDGYAAAWGTAQSSTSGPASLWLTRLGADGAPAGTEARLDVAGRADRKSLRLVSLPAGGLAAVWAEPGDDTLRRLVARRFDGSLQALDQPVTIATAIAAGCRISTRAAGALRDGGYQVVWSVVPAFGVVAPDCSGTFTRRIASDGQPVGSAVRLDGNPGIAAVRADGTIVGLHSETDAFVQLFAADGQALSAERSVASGPGYQIAADVAVDSSGGFLVLWSSGTPFSGQLPIGQDVYGRFYNPDGSPLGGAFRINTVEEVAGIDQILPHAASDGRGGWAVSWADQYVMGLDHFYGGGGWVARFSSCPEGLFCLETGHFRLDVAWRNPRTGETGSGQAVPVAGETGAFWFFDAANIELFAKVLDGRGVNGNFWVFYGSLSDVEYTLTVTDAATGAVKSYFNPPYTLASHADTEAFPEAGLPAPESAPAASGAALSPPDPAKTLCAPGSEDLCLQGQRYAVEVTWTDPRTGQRGRGQAVALSGDSGYFWFFGPGNVELVVKVLNGQAVNGHTWVFYASLTDLAYAITVTDVQTARTRTYHNPPYTLASRADTQAF